MNVRTVEIGFNPTIGNIIGSTVPQELLNSISTKIENMKNFGSDILNEIRDIWVNKLTNPIKQQVLDLMPTKLKDINKIRPIVTKEDLFSIPPSMYLPIILHPPVRKLLEQERIWGFGYNPEWLPEEDYFGRIINNGKVENVEKEMFKEEDGNWYIEFKNTWLDTDPNLTFDEMEAIAETREFLDKIINETEYDPTDYPSIRG